MNLDKAFRIAKALAKGMDQCNIEQAKTVTEGIMVDITRCATKWTLTISDDSAAAPDDGQAYVATIVGATEYDQEWKALLERFRARPECKANKPYIVYANPCRYDGWRMAAYPIDTDDESGMRVELSYGQEAVSACDIDTERALRQLEDKLNGWEVPWPPLARCRELVGYYMEDLRRDINNYFVMSGCWRLSFEGAEDQQGMYNAVLQHRDNIWKGPARKIRGAAGDALIDQLKTMRDTIIKAYKSGISS